MKDFQYPDDIYTEAETDPNTLANLGPLARLAGVWEGKRGVDINPKAEGPEKDPYIERYEAHPTDGQTNGPQLYYGLRYHTHIVGNAPADAKEFTVKAVRGSLTNGIISNPFLERSFTTESFEMTVKFHDDGSWSYDQTTTMIIPNYDAPFEHRDRNRLTKIGEPKLNPTAAAEQEGE